MYIGSVAKKLPQTLSLGTWVFAAEKEIDRIDFIFLCSRDPVGTMADTAKEEIKTVEMDVEATEVPTEGTKKPGLTLQGS